MDVPPHILFTKSNGGDEFSEMEFFPDGRAAEYYFTLDEQYIPLKDRWVPSKIYPFMTVCSFTWEMKGKKLFFGRRTPTHEFHYEKERDWFWRAEHTLTSADTVKWFDRLKEYCGDPVFGGGEKRIEGAKGGETAGLPFRFLRQMTNEGFIEYEFRTDGRALIYYDREKAPDPDKDDYIYKLPLRFSVELVPFKIGNRKVEVDQADKGVETLSWSGNGEITSTQGNEWKQVEHLEFVRRLYDYCERPLPDGR
jgi:hypothetical protein